MNKFTDFLLVEDDENDVQLMRHAFAQGGFAHRLHAVHDGKEAMAYLAGEEPYSDRKKYPLPGVILLDLKMPRVNGFEFLEWLNTESPGDLRLLPVIVMSSSKHEKDVRKAYELGANCYLVKPVSWGEFLERMKTINVFWGDHVEMPPVKV